MPWDSDLHGMQDKLGCRRGFVPCGPGAREGYTLPGRGCRRGGNLSGTGNRHGAVPMPPAGTQTSYVKGQIAFGADNAHVCGIFCAAGRCGVAEEAERIARQTDRQGGRSFSFWLVTWPDLRGLTLASGKPPYHGALRRSRQPGGA